MMVALDCLGHVRGKHILTTDPLANTVVEIETSIFELQGKYAKYEREHDLSDWY